MAMALDVGKVVVLKHQAVAKSLKRLTHSALSEIAFIVTSMTSITINLISS
jgi:hypothetical protein